MLTKHDFSQIKTLIREETSIVVQRETRKIVQEETRKIVQEETRKIVQEEIKPLKHDIAKIRGDIDAIISLFDREYVSLRRRVERIEDHLNLAPLPA